MAAPGKKTNWFAIWISVAVVVAVVVVGGVVVWMNNAASAPVEPPAAGAVDEETGAITIGDGPDELETYIDFMCPYCGQFEESWGDTISEQVEQGNLTLKVYPLGMLDRQSLGTEYSSRAANAMYCVTEENADAAYPFMRELFDHQPAEQTEGLSNEEIIGYAEQVGAGGAASCIEDRAHDDFLDKTSEAMSAAGASGTPAVFLNGTEVNWQGDPETELVAKLQG